MLATQRKTIIFSPLREVVIISKPMHTLLKHILLPFRNTSNGVNKVYVRY